MTFLNQDEQEESSTKRSQKSQKDTLQKKAFQMKNPVMEDMDGGQPEGRKEIEKQSTHNPRKKPSYTRGENQVFISPEGALSQTPSSHWPTAAEGLTQDFSWRMQKAEEDGDQIFDRAMRPKAFQDFVGRNQNVENLKIFMQAANQRDEPLDHVLLHGPPGLGKTTLAHLIAQGMKRELKTCSGPVLTKPGDLVAILSQLTAGDLLFIDEIHRLPIAVEEILYGAMEDQRIDIVIGQGVNARSLQLTLPPFTVLGATTRVGLLSSPLRDRFGISVAMDFYHPQELSELIKKACLTLDFQLDEKALENLSHRCRGTPRIALRLLRRLRDFNQTNTFTLQQKNNKAKEMAFPDMERALNQMGIDQRGLDGSDHLYLRVLGFFFKGGPAGLDTLVAATAQSRDTLEDVVEPYLLRHGIIQRTGRGRLLTSYGRELLHDLKEHP